MKLNKNFLRLAAVAIALIWISSVGAFSFFKSKEFSSFLVWSQNHTFIFFWSMVTLKFSAIVYPPLPGSIFTLTSIPILGWKLSFLADFLGAITGATVSYYLAKKYGFTLVSKLFDPQTIIQIQNTKIKKGREIEAILAFRILTAGTVIEAVNYAAGLIQISFPKFAIATVISHPLVGLPVFYSAGRIFEGKNIIFSFGLLLLAIPLIYRLRGRYFE